MIVFAIHLRVAGPTLSCAFGDAVSDLPLTIKVSILITPLSANRFILVKTSLNSQGATSSTRSSCVQ